MKVTIKKDSYKPEFKDITEGEIFKLTDEDTYYLKIQPIIFPAFELNALDLATYSCRSILGNMKIQTVSGDLIIYD